MIAIKRRDIHFAIIHFVTVYWIIQYWTEVTCYSMCKYWLQILQSIFVVRPGPVTQSLDLTNQTLSKILAWTGSHCQCIRLWLVADQHTWAMTAQELEVLSHWLGSASVWVMRPSTTRLVLPLPLFQGRQNHSSESCSRICSSVSQSKLSCRDTWKASQGFESNFCAATSSWNSVDIVSAIMLGGTCRSDLHVDSNLRAEAFYLWKSICQWARLPQGRPQNG
jgi:hypothetical protein